MFNIKSTCCEQLVTAPDHQHENNILSKDWHSLRMPAADTYMTQQRELLLWQWGGGRTLPASAIWEEPQCQAGEPALVAYSAHRKQQGRQRATSVHSDHDTGTWRRKGRVPPEPSGLWYIEIKGMICKRGKGAHLICSSVKKSVIELDKLYPPLALSRFSHRSDRISNAVSCSLSSSSSSLSSPSLSLGPSWCNTAKHCFICSTSFNCPLPISARACCSHTFL